MDVAEFPLALELRLFFPMAFKDSTPAINQVIGGRTVPSPLLFLFFFRYFFHFGATISELLEVCLNMRNLRSEGSSLFILSTNFL